MKPANILLDFLGEGPRNNKAFTWNDLNVETLVVKVTDFGLSRLITQDGAHSLSLVGTVGYLAPEVERRKYSFSADIFSIAMITAVMVSRKEPEKIREEIG